MTQRNAMQPVNNSVEVEVIEYVPSNRPLAGRFLGSSHARELKNIQHASVMENCKAAMTLSAMQHAAAFSQIEERVALQNPHAGARCRALANAYTVEAIKLIMDGEKR